MPKGKKSDGLYFGLVCKGCFKKHDAWKTVRGAIPWHMLIQAAYFRFLT